MIPLVFHDLGNSICKYSVLFFHWKEVCHEMIHVAHPAQLRILYTSPTDLTDSNYPLAAHYMSGMVSILCVWSVVPWHRFFEFDNCLLCSIVFDAFWLTCLFGILGRICDAKASMVVFVSPFQPVVNWWFWWFWNLVDSLFSEKSKKIHQLVMSGVNILGSSQLRLSQASESLLCERRAMRLLPFPWWQARKEGSAGAQLGLLGFHDLLCPDCNGM